MRAILIDVHKKEIREVELLRGDHLQTIYALLGCSLISTAAELAPNGDTVFVDDEGLLKNPPDPAFAVGGKLEYPVQEGFFGNGIIMGAPDENGNSTNAKSSLDDIRARITFIGQVYV